MPYATVPPVARLTRRPLHRHVPVQQALKWFQAAGQAGDNDSAMAAAKILGKELHMMPEAVHWFGVAAELGEVRAMFNLGLFHQRGMGVPASLHLAAGWYRAGA